MRLSELEKSTIREETLRLDPKAEIWLIGSRANDELKGGDIDLLIVSDLLGLSQKLDLLVALKLRIGDQKIDITVVSRELKAVDPFARSALPAAVRL